MGREAERGVDGKGGVMEYKPSGRHDSPIDPDRCKASVYHATIWESHQCSRKPWKDGWCKQHHPDTIAERERIRDLRYKQKRANGPWERLARAQKEIEQLKARIAELEA